MDSVKITSLERKKEILNERERNHKRRKKEILNCIVWYIFSLTAWTHDKVKIIYKKALIQIISQFICWYRERQGPCGIRFRVETLVAWELNFCFFLPLNEKKDITKEGRKKKSNDTIEGNGKDMSSKEMGFF